MEQINSVLKIFLSRVIGFGVFILLLIIANLLIPYISNEKFSSVVLFLNENVFFIIVFTLLMLIGEMFMALSFPFNLPAPLFNAVGGIFMVTFIFNLLIFLSTIIKELEAVRIPFEIFSVLASSLVFILIIIFGYIHIFLDVARAERARKLRKKLKRE
jgi:hypothetical protein